ncbi:MAG: nitrous oxide reductase accessory protein NosL [Alphaproteobacteria bacterium]|nr:nitrous oxide reductase accessory protein NosL [Alphaproteobacteria bacterium]MBF0250058.1 nitrous oxide reductase accessory protein NosL [Alphaproteobacteria bacterium]
MNRRQLLMSVAAGGLLAVPGLRPARAEGKMIMPWEWVEKQGEVTNTDGTPLQFMPKGAKDPNPLENELEKYPSCPYCGMNRTKFSHTRHLIHYSDDLVDGTCSIHCAAISLSLNLDRVPKAIYAGDAGSDAPVKPLVNVDQAHYVIDPGKMGTMTKRSKFAYADKAKADAAGGEVTNFDAAVTAAYADMAADTVMLRERREAKRREAKGKAQGMEHGGKPMDK